MASQIFINNNSNSEVFAFALVGHQNNSCNWLSKAETKLAVDNLGLAKNINFGPGPN